MKLDRLFAITMLLINHKRISAKELSNRFEVSPRTIYRDIEAINQAGIPVVAYPGTNGGFGILENYKIDRNLLTVEEIISVITALKGVNSTLEDSKISHTMEKIKGLIPDWQMEEFNKRNRQVVIDFNPWGVTESQREKLNTLRKAIEENRLVSFYYTNARYESIQRLVEPLSLVFKGYSWYLYGYCRVKEDFRVFRFSRIKNLNMEDESFTPRDKSYEESMYESTWGNPGSYIDIVLRFNKRVEMNVSEFYGDEAVQIDKDGSLIVSVRYPEDEWVYGNILSYGENVEVLEPPHLREIIREKARRISELYGNS